MQVRTYLDQAMSLFGVCSSSLFTSAASYWLRFIVCFRVISCEEGKALAESWNAAFMESSAKENQVKKYFIDLFKYEPIVFTFDSHAGKLITEGIESCVLCWYSLLLQQQVWNVFSFLQLQQGTPCSFRHSIIGLTRKQIHLSSVHQLFQQTYLWIKPTQAQGAHAQPCWRAANEGFPNSFTLLTQ